MTPAKVNVFFAFFPYAGTGGTSAEHPAVRRWVAKTLLACKADPRVGEVYHHDFCDTPVTMSRNSAVRLAKHHEADFLVMCDSDMHPDFELGRGDPQARPFWDAAFDLAYARRQRGLLTCVAAPYCGPPPHENVYVFRWANAASDHPNADARLEQFGREEAAGRGGLEEVGALPTGLVLWDLRCFEFLEPPYFYYEYTDRFETEKASTEDVTATRDLSLTCAAKFGYNPLFAAWDSWAGHVKQKTVGKPRPYTVASVSQKLQRGMLSGLVPGQQLVHVGAGGVNGAARGGPSAAPPANGRPGVKAAPKRQK